MKLLTPWKLIAPHTYALCEFGSQKDPIIKITKSAIYENEYTTGGMYPWFSELGPFTYPTLEEARRFVNNALIDRGYRILTEEEVAKLEILL